MQTNFQIVLEHLSTRNILENYNIFETQAQPQTLCVITHLLMSLLIQGAIVLIEVNVLDILFYLPNSFWNLL